MEVQQKSTVFHIGQNVDVLDKVNKWLNGQILGIQNNQLFIHYTGWHPKFDQLVTIDSGRILKQWEHGKQIKLNNRIDVYHPIGGWLQARVIQLAQINCNHKNTKVKVHFFNYHPKYDMWVDLQDKNQVTLIGEKSKGYGIGKRKRNQNNKKKLLSELAKQILRQKLSKMLKEFDQSGLMMKQVGGDGNCLFRAVSDQLYGQQTFHNQIRQLCMKYILQQKSFFQNYLVQDIQQYVQRKSQSGVWGDDIQIQALSQIYARPIQIYAMGIKPIRTFHQDNQYNIQPLRLAYIGSCHYNSIKKRNQQTQGLIPTRFGQFQNIFFNTYFNHKNSQIYWINKNRDKFSHFNPLQQTIEQRIQSQTTDNKIEIEEQNIQKDVMQQVMEISQNQQIQKQIQAAELKEIQLKLEQQAIQKQIKKLEQKQLEEIKKISMIDANQSYNNQVNSLLKNQKQRPYWFQDLLMMGFTPEQIWFAIDIKGYNPEQVQNFLLDNM